MLAWSGIARLGHRQEWLRYPSDITDADSVITARFAPRTKRDSPPQSADMGENEGRSISQRAGVLERPSLALDQPWLYLEQSKEGLFYGTIGAREASDEWVGYG